MADKIPVRAGICSCWLKLLFQLLLRHDSFKVIQALHERGKFESRHASLEFQLEVGSFKALLSIALDTAETGSLQCLLEL